MKFLGTSVFQSDGFHIFCYISYVKKSLKIMLCQGKGKSMLRKGKKQNMGKEPNALQDEEEQVQSSLQGEKSIYRILTGLM